MYSFPDPMPDINTFVLQLLPGPDKTEDTGVEEGVATDDAFA
jgi:hypothetical protein